MYVSDWHFSGAWKNTARATSRQISFDLWECRTLADLIKSQTFKVAAQSAWDRCLEKGLKHEEGVYFFYTPKDPGFSYWDIPRNTRSLFTPWIPERAREVATSNSIIWTASLHTHPFRHNERYHGNIKFVEPWLPSQEDINASKETPNIWHITLYPNMKSFNIFVLTDGKQIEEKYWKNYFRCAWKKTS